MPSRLAIRRSLARACRVVMIGERTEAATASHHPNQMPAGTVTPTTEGVDLQPRPVALYAFAHLVLSAG
jgi:hypothetical protein